MDFVQQLVHALNEPQHTFVIHVDLKAADVHEALSQVYAPTDTTETAVNTSVFPEHYDQLINHAIPVRRGGGRFGNVWVMQEEREACNWGGFSIVNATLNAMRLAVFTLQRPFDYCMDVSGTSYPIKTNNVSLLSTSCRAASVVLRLSSFCCPFPSNGAVLLCIALVLMGFYICCMRILIILL